MLNELPGHSVQLQKGEFLWQEGSPPDWVALLESGELEVVRYSLDGECAILNVLTSGQLLGEMSALDGSAHSASVRARTACQVRRCATDEFLRWVRENDRWRELLKGQARRLRDLSSRFVENSLESVRTRLIRLLLDGQSDTLGVTHQELAERLGTTRESVSKALGELSKQGLLQLSRGKIHLRSRAQLQALI